MLSGGNRHAGRIGSAGQFIERSECVRTEFGGSSLCARAVFVVHADQLGVVNFAVHPSVIAPEFARSDHGDANLSRLRHRRHSLFIPTATSFSSAAGAGATASIAMPAASANSISFVRS